MPSKKFESPRKSRLSAKKVAVEVKIKKEAPSLIQETRLQLPNLEEKGTDLFMKEDQTRGFFMLQGKQKP